MATSSDDVAWLLGVMRELGAEPIVAGGWGVDALWRNASRVHRDLDVLVQSDLVELITNRLLGEGFAVTTDWLPVRIELSDVDLDRHVDLHPVVDDGRGGWWQHGLDDTRFEYPAEALTDGQIGDTSVRCLTASKQRDLHAEYEPRAEDLHDLGLLNDLMSTGH